MAGHMQLQLFMTALVGGKGSGLPAGDAMEPPAALQARLNEGMDWMGPLLPPGFWGPVGEGSTSA